MAHGIGVSEIIQSLAEPHTRVVFQRNNTAEQFFRQSNSSYALYRSPFIIFPPAPLFFSLPRRFSSEQATSSLHVDSFLCASRRHCVLMYTKHRTTARNASEPHGKERNRSSSGFLNVNLHILAVTRPPSTHVRRVVLTRSTSTFLPASFEKKNVFISAGTTTAVLNS